MNTPDDMHAGEPANGSPDGHRHVDVATMVMSAIADVAPEVEPELVDLDHDVDVWNELQLDSMDHLAVMTRLSEQTGIEIAERNYPRLTTIRSLCEFLSAGGD